MAGNHVRAELGLAGADKAPARQRDNETFANSDIVSPLMNRIGHTE